MYDVLVSLFLSVFLAVVLQGICFLLLILFNLKEKNFSATYAVHVRGNDIYFCRYIIHGIR